MTPQSQAPQGPPKQAHSSNAVSELPRSQISPENKALRRQGHASVGHSTT